MTETTHDPRSERVRTAALLVGTMALLTGLLVPRTARAQEAEAPAIAESPRPFRLGPTVGVLAWEEGPASTLDDVALLGLGVERTVASFLAVRLDGGVGGGSVADDQGRTADVTTYLAEVALAVRAPVGALAETGVVPYAAGGLGTVVHDPAPDDLSTTSQNALSYGLGVDVRPLERFGARLEWRRYSVDLENLFDRVDRTGTSRDADRFTASLYWAF